MTVIGVTPFLYYAKPAEALDWLRLHLKFGDDVRWTDEAGEVAEADIHVCEGVKIAIGGRAPGSNEGAGLVIIVHVDDVDAHYEHLRAGGLDVDRPVDQPYGHRTLTVTDPGGYRWSLWQGQPHPPS